MGTEAVWIPLVIAAVGTGVQMYNTQQTEKRTNNAIAQQLADQAAIDKRGQKLVNDELLKQQGSNPEGYRQNSLDQYMDQIIKSGGKANAGLNLAGGTSQAFKDSSKQVGQDIFANSAATADSLSRIDAPGLQRMNEGISFNRLGSDIGRVGAQSDSARYLGDIQIRRAGQRDPWLDALGSGMQSYGASGGGL